MAHIFLSLAVITCLLFRLSAPTGIRLQLTHVDAKLNLTKTEFSRRAVERTKHRVASLTSSLASTGNNVQAPLHRARISYQIDIAIGTPSIPQTVIADTGSDLVWTQCAPCGQCFPQPNAIYDPSKSNTFSKLECSSSPCQSLPSRNRNCNGTDCDYYYSYADRSYTQGLIASETFTFGSVSVPGLAFGCGRTNNDPHPDGSAGIAGLGRGPLSLVSQLGAGKFSYCLTSFGESRTSPLLIGSLASLSGAAQSTPLVQNPNPNLKSLYYLSLQGISVGPTLLPIPSAVFALNSDGSGGMVIDSGSTYTSLQYQGYEILKQEFQSQVDLPVADGSRTLFDLCFSYPSNAPPQVSIPKLVFHFDGADMEFPLSNYMIQYVDVGLLCLTMLKSNGISILGGFQQQNMHVLYDLSNNALSFATAQCDQL